MATQGVWCAFRAHYLGHPWRLLGDAAKVAAAAHLLATTTYTWGPVSGPSMMPAWEVWGDGAVTSRLYRRGKGVKVGDLVEFKVPVNEGVAIKRVAGLPGDYVLEGSPDSGRQEMIQVSCCCGQQGHDDGGQVSMLMIALAQKGPTRPLLGSRRQHSCVSGLQELWTGTNGFDLRQSNLQDTPMALALAQDSEPV